MKTSYTVHELARAAGVTVRALHHYDSLGLLTPQRDEVNNYRYYGSAELLRLQQILLFKELDLPLSKIKTMLDASDFDNLAMLRAHRQVIGGSRRRLGKILTSIDQTIQKLESGGLMTTQDLFGGLSQKKLAEFSKEAEERWGNTQAYRESAIRVKQMGQAGLARIVKEGQEIAAALSSLMDHEITDPEVQTLVSAHRANLSHFYTLTDEIYRGLDEMYVADPRFAATYEAIKPGLADFLSRAMLASLNTH